MKSDDLLLLISRFRRDPLGVPIDTGDRLVKEVVDECQAAIISGPKGLEHLSSEIGRFGHEYYRLEELYHQAMARGVAMDWEAGRVADLVAERYRDAGRTISDLLAGLFGLLYRYYHADELELGEGVRKLAKEVLYPLSDAGRWFNGLLNTTEPKQSPRDRGKQGGRPPSGECEMSGWDLGLYCAVRGKYQWSGDYVLGLLRKYNLRASKSRQEDFGKAIKLWKLALKATPDALQGAMELMNIKSERSMKIWENRIDAAMSGIDHGDSIRAARALLNALDAQRRTK